MTLITGAVASGIFAITGLEVQTNHLAFLVSLYVSLIGSYVFKYILSKYSINVYLIANGLFGLWLYFFNWGWSILYMLVDAVGSYILLRSLSPKIAYKYTFTVSMFLLSVCHLERLVQFLNNASDEYQADFTGSLMILTQRITALSLSMYDGMHRKDSELTESQRKFAVRKLPSFVEYFGYMFNFHGMLAGPFLFYTDWKKSVESSLKEKDVSRSSPSSAWVVLSKVCGGMLMICFFWFGSQTFPCAHNTDPKFIANASLWHRVFFLYMSLLVARTKYYGVWLFADGIHNSGGIGFNGYDESGTPKWNLASNVSILKIELATGLKSYIDSWNITTTLWLRHVAYDRLPSKYRTLTSFLLSAVWHGFFPGYYVMFLSSHVCLLVQRKVRRVIRPAFQNSEVSRAIYEIATLIVTQLTIAYVCLPFVTLEVSGPVRFYKSVWFAGHVISLALMFMLPGQRSRHSEHLETQPENEKFYAKNHETNGLLLPNPLKQNIDNHVRHR